MKHAYKRNRKRMKIRMKSWRNHLSLLKYSSALYSSKKPFPYSNVATIIAQAGATLPNLGTTPVNTPDIPFCCQICRKILNVVFGTGDTKNIKIECTPCIATDLRRNQDYLQIVLT